jgi:polyhydroxyalkanoate synthase
MATKTNEGAHKTRSRRPRKRKQIRARNTRGPRSKSAAASVTPPPEADESKEDLIPGASPLLAFEATDVLIAVGKLMAAAAKSPTPLLKRLRQLSSDLTEIATGKKRLAPAKNDRRFLDPAWNESESYRLLLQTYLAVAGFLRDIPSCIGLDKRDELARIGLNFAAEGIAPTNSWLGNPAAIKRAIDTGGASLLSGTKHFIEQMSGSRGHPSQVNTEDFEHGVTVASTPGKVVYRHEMFELLQYTPATETVFEVPILFFCSPVNQYYVLDLAPGKSLFEYLVAQRYTVFAMSLRNPEPKQGHWSLDHYARAMLKATDVVREITASPTLHIATACAGGIIGTLFAAALAGQEDRRVQSVTSLVSLIDSHRLNGSLPLMANKKVAQRAVARTAKRGVLRGDQIFWMFSLLRPNEAFWSYWVDNFLLGNSPAPSDLLFWSNESTNLPAALLRDLLDVYVHNKAIQTGGMRVLDRPVTLSDLKIDLYALAAEKDHLVPWQSGYNSLRHFSGRRTFVLHSKGHIMALIDPPATNQATFCVGSDGFELEADVWRAKAMRAQGSWWPHWCDWLQSRSGAVRAANPRQGSAKYPPLANAPGEYVRFKRHSNGAS